MVILVIATMLTYRQGYINGYIDGRLREKYRRYEK